MVFMDENPTDSGYSSGVPTAWVREVHNSDVPYTRDPFDQALDHTYALRRLIDEMPGWRERPVLVGHALSFPEVSLNERRYPPEAPRQILIDRNDVAEIEAAIERIHFPPRESG